MSNKFGDFDIDSNIGIFNKGKTKYARFKC